MIARKAALALALLSTVLALPATATATPPGPNGRIVFTRAGDLHSVAPDGTGLVRLTWSNTDEQHPSWSPDGTRIAFGSFLEGRQSIHVMNADGSGERRASPDGYESDDMEPAWSPDGTQIAFASTRPYNGSWHIWVMNADGSGLRRVTGAFSTSPAWSPDGTRLAYLEAGGGISVVRVEGGNAQRVTQPHAGTTDERPSWSPDGTELVFARRQTYGNDPQLYVVRSDGSGERQLTSTEGASRFPSWSPDGTQIVFTHIGRLSVIGADGSGMRPLVEPWGDDLTPDWGSSTAAPEPPDVPGAPRIEIFSPEAQLYPSGYEVGAFYVCESETSFVVSCEGDVPIGSPIDTQTAGHHTFTVQARDIEGRTSTKTVSYDVLDWREPTIVVRAPADGAAYGLGERVEVDYECLDEPGGSGIQLCDGELRPGQPLDTSRTGSFTVRFWAVDRSNNVAETAVTYRVADLTPPEISVSSPEEGAVYLLGSTVLASYSCRDDSHTSCVGDVGAGSALDTASVGPKSFTVRARDGGGNVTTVRRSYRVIYPFSAFSWPGESAAGEKVAIRFSLGADRGLTVVASSTWTHVGCQDVTPLGQVSTASGRLSYQGGRYRYHAETLASWEGSCRQLAITLDDGTTHQATIELN